MSEPYRGDDPFVYISYVREDHAIVQPEIELLQDLGIRCFFDTGETDVHTEEVKKCAFVLVMVSDMAEDSEALQKEVGLALQESKQALCIHLADVPLDGKAALLLGGVQDVKKFRMPDHLYLRRIVGTLPDEVKTRPITIPEPEAAQSAAPPPKPKGPPIGDRIKAALEQLKEVDPKILAGGGVLLLLFVVGLIAVATSGGPGRGSGVEEKTLVKKTETPAEKAAREKAEQEAAEREKKRQAELAIERKQEEAKWLLKENLRKGTDKLEAQEFAEAVKLLTVGIEQKELKKGKMVLIDLAKAYLARARAYNKLRKKAAAIKDLTAYIAINDKNPDAFWERARARQRSRELKGAAEDYGKVIALDEKRVLAHRYQGDCYRRLKKYKEAIASYTRNIELDPKDAAAYRYRGDCKKKSGDTEGASEDYAKAREVQRR